MSKLKKRIELFIFKTSFLKNIRVKVGFVVISSIMFSLGFDTWKNPWLWLGALFLLFTVLIAEALYEFLALEENRDEGEE